MLAKWQQKGVYPYPARGLRDQIQKKSAPDTHTQSFMHRGYNGQREIETMVSEGARPWVRGRTEFAKVLTHLLLLKLRFHVSPQKSTLVRLSLPQCFCLRGTKHRPWSEQNSDQNSEQNSDHPRLCIYWGKEKLRPWSKSLGRENSDHGLSSGCFWGRGRWGGSQERFCEFDLHASAKSQSEWRLESLRLLNSYVHSEVLPLSYLNF